MVSGTFELPEAVKLSPDLYVYMSVLEKNIENPKDIFTSFKTFYVTDRNKQAKYEIMLPKNKEFYVVLNGIYKDIPFEYGTLVVKDDNTGNMTFDIKPDIKSLEAEVNIAKSQAELLYNWATVSNLHQFKYKNEGLAYAYIKGSSLIIKTPKKELSLKVQYPLLGDVISDDDGNFYVVWGKENTGSTNTVETVFISKYSSDGSHVKTTGFVGKSSLWGNEANTQLPFHAGNSASVIANGILVNYHAKKRYDGHQSDNVIAVRIADMSPYQLPNDTYTGHSFNQSVIYSEKISDFLFASQGDGYSRGFRVNDSSGGYGIDKETIFHFYLQANVNYDMSILNRTYAQLGGLAETSKGVALVGSSVKSISEEAKTEKQNLFIQIFDPRIKDNSLAKFIGGVSRTGATSYDFYDNQNKPLTSVTDYGVIWLTNYTDRDVIAPQVVAADDRIVILWTESIGIMAEAYYMVVSAEGKVLIPKTSLEGMKLNSYERPVYHDGSIYWSYLKNGAIKIGSIKL